MAEIKFIIDNFDGKNFNITDFQECLKRAKALADSIETIEKITGKKDSYNTYYEIIADGTNYADEYTLIRRKEQGLVEEFPIEILTDKQAENNEIEEINDGCIIGVDSTEGYKLGETVQWYSQVGNTNYWYREL